MSESQRDHLAVQRERAILVACLLPGNQNDPHDPLGELRSLADTAGAVVVDEVTQNRPKPVAGTFIGTGKVKELAEKVLALKVDVIIFDNDLSPSQIANIEEVVLCKVLDRSELILDIFAARARTHEAKLQVELAQLEYTYPRLRAMWSHLERIVGGSPTGIGTRGPGEQQLEIDRRIVQQRRSELRREIKKIQGRKEREVAARNQDFFTVGLVGYTNAGKSTLFNTVTGSDEYADNRLFTTLSTRTRRWDLGSGDSVMLSDTVGFVRDLPHHLVASFRATLEEAVHSDLLLVVLDVSHPRALKQLETVMTVLDEIGANKQERLLLLNKIDVLTDNADLLVFQRQYPSALALSAKTGRGVHELINTVHQASQGKTLDLTVEMRLSQGKELHFLESRAQVLDRQYGAGTVVLKVRIGQRQYDQFRATGARVKLLEEREAPAGALTGSSSSAEGGADGADGSENSATPGESPETA